MLIITHTSIAAIAAHQNSRGLFIDCIPSMETENSVRINNFELTDDDGLHADIYSVVSISTDGTATYAEKGQDCKLTGPHPDGMLGVHITDTGEDRYYEIGAHALFLIQAELGLPFPA